METHTQFRRRVKEHLRQIDPKALCYNEDEFWMVQSPYEYIEYYATKKRLLNTAIALPLARGLHNGTYRKSSLMKDGKPYRLPYLIHPLLVCRMLAEMDLPLSSEEEDILLAVAMCHDMIEDLPFPQHGWELVSEYHLDPRVYEIVKKLSKRKDFTEEEELAFFHEMEQDPLALLVKLSDRGNNVEDLYNRSVWKVHEYVGETRKLFLPMCQYARVHYPKLLSAIEILEGKITTLTEASEILVNRYDARERELTRQVEELRAENQRLRERWKQLWEE